MNARWPDINHSTLRAQFNADQDIVGHSNFDYIWQGLAKILYLCPIAVVHIAEASLHQPLSP
jgi:hypothetical protein